jgi:hypothetical protein
LGEAGSHTLIYRLLTSIISASTVPNNTFIPDLFERGKPVPVRVIWIPPLTDPVAGATWSRDRGID